jgi:hypothetical protein
MPIHTASLARLFLALLVLLARAASAVTAGPACCGDERMHGVETRALSACADGACASEGADHDDATMESERDGGLSGPHGASRESHDPLPCSQGCPCCAAFTAHAAGPALLEEEPRASIYASPAGERVSRPIPDSIDHPPC